jgi:hypothetical protein
VTATLVQFLAAALLLVVLWRLFRVAMGLWVAKLDREEARRATEARGGRVVVEIPTADGATFFVDETDAFRWGAAAARKADVAGARLLLNGAVVTVVARNGAQLPLPAAVAVQEERESWAVELHLLDGRTMTVPCGTLREGVSREIAARVFAAVRDGVGGGPGLGAEGA